MLRTPSMLLTAALLFAGALQAAETVPPEVEQPGTQAREAGHFETPDKCDNCHAGYDGVQPENEPATGWRGAPMGNAARDPIFWATLAIAERGYDGSGDLCIRCHSAAGWYGGRSTPTDGSGLRPGDDAGVDCDTCHVLTNPDNSEHIGVMRSPYVANCDADVAVPFKCTTTGSAGEAFYGGGMASILPTGDKLGPYADAAARHHSMQSRFHRSADFCGTCHDVSNPVVGDLASGNGAQPGAPHVVSSQDFSSSGLPNIGGPVEEKAAFNNPPYAYGVTERTYSEYRAGMIGETRVADYLGLPTDLRAVGGALEATYLAALGAGTGGNYADGSTRFFSCQSCHMPPVKARGANKHGARLRSDLPMHDQTGGNYWFGNIIKYQDAHGLLRLGGDLTASQNLALDLGQRRAAAQLRRAADLVVSGDTLRVVNLTGHKLITGYPEGRRMWLNLKWYDASGNLLREDGAYGPIGVSISNPAGGPSVAVESIIDLDDPNLVIYDAHYAVTQEWAERLMNVALYPPGFPLSYDRVTGAVECTLGQLASLPPGSYQETFHFALNNRVASDSRIPPYGMRFDVARQRNVLPVPASQYGGGGPGSAYRHWDEIDLAAMRPGNAVRAQISLLYQGTSWEYIQFLHLANDGRSTFLASEGVNLLEAWVNAEIPVAMEVAGDRRMVPPFVMATAVWGSAAPPPDLDEVGVVELQTGLLAGKGRHVSFKPLDVFKRGNTIVFRARVEAGANPLAGATVSLAIDGPVALTLTSGPSDAAGIAEARWQTSAATHHGQGGTPAGVYTATTVGVNATGYAWDGIATAASFSIAE